MKTLVQSVVLTLFLIKTQPIKAQIYCPTKGTFSWEQWIEYVAVSSGEGNLIYPTTSKEGYGNFTAQNPATIIRNTYNLLTISPKSSWNGDPRNANMFWRAWIDFNQDGDFEDDNEQIVSRQIVINYNTFLDNEQSFFVPLSVQSGNTRLRVAMKVGAYPEPCETFERGEVEDYTIHIKDSDPSVGKDTLRLVTVTGDTSVRQGGFVKLNITLKNTGTAPSSTLTPLSIYQLQRPFAFKGPQPWCFGIVSNSLPIGLSIQPNETVTLPFLFKMADYFTHLSPYLPTITYGSTNVTIGRRDSYYCNSVFIYGGVIDTLLYGFNIKAILDSSDLSSEIIATDTTYSDSGVLNFIVKVKNNGSVNVKNVITNINYTPNFSNKITISPQRGTFEPTFFFGTYYNLWTIDELVASESLTAQVTVKDSSIAALVPTVGVSAFCTSNQIIDFKTSNNLSNKTFKKQEPAVFDLGVALTANPSFYTKFNFLNFIISVKNNGNQVLKNVVVEFKFPSGTVNGGFATPSVGTWEEWCAGNYPCFKWTIPVLNINQTATLTVPVFVSNINTPIVATATLLSSSPTDVNAADNQASITIDPISIQIAQNLSEFVLNKNRPIYVENLEPSITEGVVVIQLESIVEQEISFEIYNHLGVLMHNEKRLIGKGANRLDFNMAALPAGMYFIVPMTTSRARSVPLKVVKM